MQNSGTSAQAAQRETILYSLTTTLSAPLSGLPQSLGHLANDPIAEECRVLLLSLQSLDVTGTFSLTSSQSSYMISGFVEGNEVCLDISLNPELGQPEPVIPIVPTKAPSIFSKLVTWLFQQRRSTLSTDSTSRTEV